jgi:hypothetical protein
VQSAEDHSFCLIWLSITSNSASSTGSCLREEEKDEALPDTLLYLLTVKVKPISRRTNRTASHRAMRRRMNFNMVNLNTSFCPEKLCSGQKTGQR